MRGLTSRSTLRSGVLLPIAEPVLLLSGMIIRVRFFPSLKVETIDVTG